MTKEDNLIPNGVKCNENVIWVSVLRLGFYLFIWDTYDIDLWNSLLFYSVLNKFKINWTAFVHLNLEIVYETNFLAHLSTKWSVVVRRRALSVVRRPSTFDVYTLETTFLTWFWWNLIRMFVLTISRASSNMGHVRSKTRSPGQILGNSCLHSRGHICDPILMILCQNVCIDNI